MKAKEFRDRFYRQWVKNKDLFLQEIVVKDTDVLVSSNKKIDKRYIRDLINKYRQQIEDYIRADQNFLHSLAPISVDKKAAKIIQDMAACSRLTKVGPMAAVAGAIAQFVGSDLLRMCEDIIIENGGDIFIKTVNPRIIGIYPGENKYFKNLAINIRPQMTPLGVCTSSGTVGHSLSFGNTDASVILAKSATLADALATAVGNLVKKPKDCKRALEFAKKIKGVMGVIVIIEDTLSSWGDIEFVQTK